MHSDLLRTIRDPEKPCTLEDLNVIYEDGIFVLPPTRSNVSVVSCSCRLQLEFTKRLLPTLAGAHWIQSHCAALFACHTDWSLYTRQSRTWSAAQHQAGHLHKEGSTSNRGGEWVLRGGYPNRQLYICTYICYIFLFTSIVNKQINDKERIAAAMENPNLRELVENCIKDEE